MINHLLALNLGPINGVGVPELASPGANSAVTLAKIISTAIGLITVIVVIYFLFNLLTGGISIISAGGDKGAYEEARRKITSGVIGLIVTISAVFILDIVSTLLGFPGILNLAGVITNLRQ